MDCPPVLAYAIFLTAMAVYDIYMGSFPSFARTIFYLILGSVFLWILCAAGMSSIAWSLLGIPVVFYIFLFAILIFQKGFAIETEEKKKCGVPEPVCEEEPKCEETCTD